MFIGHLNKDQQAYFLRVAQNVVAADGNIDVRETSILQTLTAQCDQSIRSLEDISAVSAGTLFNDRQSQASLGI